MKRKIIPALGLLSLFFLAGFKPIEDTPLQKLLKQLAKITATYPQEKVHLHLDKPYYAIGEDIWMKAYVVTAEKNEPSSLSAVLYVDLIDQKEKIWKKAKLEVKEGLANGHISLLDSLGPGQYYLRAYTNYMRNYDGAFFFQQPLTIYDALEKPVSVKEKPIPEGVDLLFFPEGGDLVNGIRSRIGIKALTKDGLGTTVNGYIENSKEEKVALFNTEFAGMGFFALRPEKGEKYKAVLALLDGQTRTFNLPKAKESGHVLNVFQNDSLINIKVSTSADLIQSGKELFVIAQSNGVALASFPLKANKEMLNAAIAKKSFPTGIMQITLFEQNETPIAERLIFINRHDTLQIQVETPKSNEPRKKSELHLTVSDQLHQPVDGNFSMAVTDMGLVPYDEDEQPSILSSLLLQSDIRGRIEKPNYYFREPNADKERQLDNLLLTQGWRRFTWKDVAAGKEPVLNFRPEQSLEIGGMVSTTYGKPLNGASVSLVSITPGLSLKLDTITHAKGEFIFDRLDLPDSANFILQAKLGKEDDIILKLTESPQVKIEKQLAKRIDLTNYLSKTKEQFEDLERFNMLDKAILLKTVTISKQRELKPTQNIPNSANIIGNANFVVKSDVLEKDINIFSPFYRMTGLTIEHGIIYRVKRTSLTSRVPLLLIVDGVKINQAEMPDFLPTINPKDVAGIEVLTSDYFLAVFGDEGSGGVIFITTKTGKAVLKTTKNTVRLNNAGFSPAKEFYMPDYDDPKTNRQLKDIRSTVYWNPNVLTNMNGKTTVSYFNAGLPGKYRVTIEGIDIFGNIGRKVFTYEVTAASPR
ncbi:TonB-linked outer membrane protein, SusC/RagA family [compost metagenome]